MDLIGLRVQGFTLFHFMVRLHTYLISDIGPLTSERSHLKYLLEILLAASLPLALSPSRPPHSNYHTLFSIVDGITCWNLNVLQRKAIPGNSVNV